MNFEQQGHFLLYIVVCLSWFKPGYYFILKYVFFNYSSVFLCGGVLNLHLIKQWSLMCPRGLNLYVRIMITNCSRCLEANNLPDEKRLLIYKIYFITIMKHAYTDNIQNDHHVYGFFFIMYKFIWWKSQSALVCFQSRNKK